MSWEGYSQNICKNGHFYISSEGPCMRTENCPDCGERSAWFNLVDDTNCDEYGIVLHSTLDGLKIQDAVIETCNLGHKHTLEPAKFRIPEKGETIKRHRRYFDDRSKTYIHEEI